MIDIVWKHKFGISIRNWMKKIKYVTCFSNGKVSPHKHRDILKPIRRIWFKVCPCGESRYVIKVIIE